MDPPKADVDVMKFKCCFGSFSQEFVFRFDSECILMLFKHEYEIVQQLHNLKLRTKLMHGFK